MSFQENSEIEIAKIHQQFPNRSPEEIKEVLATAKAAFHGSRGSTRSQIISKLLAEPIS